MIGCYMNHAPQPFNPGVIVYSYFLWSWLAIMCTT